MVLSVEPFENDPFSVVRAARVLQSLVRLVLFYHRRGCAIPTIDDAAFPTDAIFANGGCSGGPSFADTTSVCHSANGSEQRNSLSRYARRRFTINTGVIDDDLRELVFAFYEARRGMSDSFRFLDLTDYEASGEPIVSGQLVKRYTCGAVSHDRPIIKPVSGTVSFSGGGTLDYETGIISGGSGGTWTGNFEIPARFASDHYTEANFFADWHEVGVEIIEAADADYPALTAEVPGVTITYALPVALEVGRRRSQHWSTYVHAGGGYSEHRETQYAARKSGYAANAIIPTKAVLESLISLFLCVRGRRTKFQYDSLNCRFERDDLGIRTTGTNAYEADIALVEV